MRDIHTHTRATIHPRAKRVTGGARDRYRPKVALAAIIIIFTSLEKSVKLSPPTPINRIATAID